MKTRPTLVLSILSLTLGSALPAHAQDPDPFKDTFPESNGGGPTQKDIGILETIGGLVITTGVRVNAGARQAARQADIESELLGKARKAEGNVARFAEKEPAALTRLRREFPDAESALTRLKGRISTLESDLKSGTKVTDTQFIWTGHPMIPPTMIDTRAALSEAEKVSMAAELSQLKAQLPVAQLRYSTVQNELREATRNFDGVQMKAYENAIADLKSGKRQLSPQIRSKLDEALEANRAGLRFTAVELGFLILGTYQVADGVHRVIKAERNKDSGVRPAVRLQSDSLQRLDEVAPRDPDAPAASAGAQ